MSPTSSKASGHIDTGILGAKYLLNALLENGRADVACRIATQKDRPSWGWWIAAGRHHLVGSSGTAAAPAITSCSATSAPGFTKRLAGINPDPAAPGFKHFFIKPNVVGDLTSARARYDSVRGRIVSDWKTATTAST